MDMPSGCDAASGPSKRRKVTQSVEDDACDDCRSNNVQDRPSMQMHVPGASEAKKTADDDGRMIETNVEAEAEAEAEDRLREQRKANNRQNQARHRQRIKEQLNDLREQLQKSVSRCENLQKDNDEKEERIKNLQIQNGLLKEYIHRQTLLRRLCSGDSPYGLRIPRGLDAIEEPTRGSLRGSCSSDAFEPLEKILQQRLREFPTTEERSFASFHPDTLATEQREEVAGKLGSVSTVVGASTSADDSRRVVGGPAGAAATDTAAASAAEGIASSFTAPEVSRCQHLTAPSLEEQAFQAQSKQLLQTLFQQQKLDPPRRQQPSASQLVAPSEVKVWGGVEGCLAYQQPPVSSSISEQYHMSPLAPVDQAYNTQAEQLFRSILQQPQEINPSGLNSTITALLADDSVDKPPLLPATSPEIQPTVLQNLRATTSTNEGAQPQVQNGILSEHQHQQWRHDRHAKPSSLLDSLSAAGVSAASFEPMGVMANLRTHGLSAREQDEAVAGNWSSVRAAIGASSAVDGTRANGVFAPATNTAASTVEALASFTDHAPDASQQHLTPPEIENRAYQEQKKQILRSLLQQQELHSPQRQSSSSCPLPSTSKPPLLSRYHGTHMAAIDQTSRSPANQLLDSIIQQSQQVNQSLLNSTIAALLVDGSADVKPPPSLPVAGINTLSAVGKSIIDDLSSVSCRNETSQQTRPNLASPVLQPRATTTTTKLNEGTTPQAQIGCGIRGERPDQYQNGDITPLLTSAPKPSSTLYGTSVSAASPVLPSHSAASFDYLLPTGDRQTQSSSSPVGTADAKDEEENTMSMMRFL